MASMKQVIRDRLSALRELSRELLGHTRIVASGSYPLYRLICIAGVISGVLTFIYGKYPASFVDATDDNYLLNVVFTAMQTIGCLMVVGAIYMHKDKDPRLSRVQMSSNSAALP